MHEGQQPGEDKRGAETPRPNTPDEGYADSIWDPNEQVGDVYEVEADDSGLRVSRLHGEPRPGADEEPVAGQPDGPETNERERQPRPQIWVGSLSDYNNGILYGEWIDAAREVGDVWADVEAMMARSPTMATTGEPAEEWGIFDYEGFGRARVYQHDDLAAVAQVARGIAEHGLAFGAWADVMEGNDEALAQFQDHFLGHYDSLPAYVEQLVDDLGYDELLDEVVPESLRPYVQLDVEAMARDMQLSGDLHAVPADDFGVWLFDGRG